MAAEVRKDSTLPGNRPGRIFLDTARATETEGSAAPVFGPVTGGVELERSRVVARASHRVSHAANARARRPCHYPPEFDLELHTSRPTLVGVSTSRKIWPTSAASNAGAPHRPVFVTTHWSVVLAAGRDDTPRASDA